MDFNSEGKNHINSFHLNSMLQVKMWGKDEKGMKNNKCALDEGRKVRT